MAVTKIATLTPSSTNTTEFTSIPGTYDDLMVIGSAKNTWTSHDLFTVNRMYWRMNNDSSNNYSYSLWGGDKASQKVANQSTWDSIYEVAGCASSYSSNNGWGHFSVYIPGYKVTTAYKTMQIVGGYSTSNSGTQSGWTSYGQWLSNSAITSIKIITSYGNYVSGTTMTLYGISNS